MIFIFYFRFHSSEMFGSRFLWWTVTQQGDKRVERQIYLSFRPHCRKWKEEWTFFTKKEPNLLGHYLRRGLGLVQYSWSCSYELGWFCLESDTFGDLLLRQVTGLEMILELLAELEKSGRGWRASQVFFWLPPTSCIRASKQETAYVQTANLGN